VTALFSGWQLLQLADEVHVAQGDFLQFLEGKRDDERSDFSLVAICSLVAGIYDAKR